MILSKDTQQFKDKLFLNNLFLENVDNPHKVNSKKMWITLNNAGIYLHPLLEKKYLQQRTCFFCGGTIVTRAADAGNSEEICQECSYIYQES